MSEEDTRTEFSSLDVLANSPPPTTAVDACLSDGFDLSNGVLIRDGSGCLLVGGEAFEWRPWKVTSPRSPIINKKGQWDVAKEAWALLEVVWPRPGGSTFPPQSYLLPCRRSGRIANNNDEETDLTDLLILGVGSSIVPISPETRQQIVSLGIRLEVLDTRNAAAQFNLLATERGVGDVAAALIPTGYKDIE